MLYVCINISIYLFIHLFIYISTLEPALEEKETNLYFIVFELKMLITNIILFLFFYFSFRLCVYYY